MDRATIVTATRGIGMSLAKQAEKLGMKKETFGICCDEIGVSANLPAEEVDHCIDIGSAYNLDEVEFKPSRFLIWSTGVFLKKSFGAMTDKNFDHLSDLHYGVPLKLLSRFHRQTKEPYHLLVVASCSSWRLREDEAVYCGLSAAKATFARNFAGDLIRERPGSKVTLINPGGIRTPFYDELDEEGEGFIDQAWFSDYLWSTVLRQTTPFEELQVLRQKPVVVGALPTVELGQKLPEVIGL